MGSEKPIILPDITMLNNIRSDLKEDPQRLERYMELFQEWLQCENHLPKDVDEHLRENFLRLCKCDLEKAKKKFEKFLAARLNLPAFYRNIVVNENYFETFPVHRQFVIHPELTPDGYRIGWVTIPESADQFDFFHMCHYFLLTVDFMLLEDTFAGFMVVYDLANMTPQTLAKINIKKLLDVMDLVYNIYPIRVKYIHLLNVPTIAITIIELVKKVINEKLAKRILTHQKLEELTKYIPENILPKEYGFNGKSLDMLSEVYKSYFLQNKGWYSKLENLKFIGPVPPNRKYLNSFDEYQMQGSFRKLEID